VEKAVYTLTENDKAESQISVASTILESDPEPISAIKPQTPPAFEHVVKTSLQKNPEERYQTAHDIKLRRASPDMRRPIPKCTAQPESPGTPSQAACSDRPIALPTTRIPW
jgi:serine/threonine protein kinase